MKIINAVSYEAMSAQVAKDLTEAMRAYPQPLLCPATGDTTVGLYKEMGNLFYQKKFNPSNWFFVGLDEWMGMNDNDNKSCHTRLKEQLFQPLHIEDEQVCFFDGKANNTNAECEWVEAFIAQHGGIDISVLGLGMNGHVGMNEPHTSVLLRSHVAELDEQTKRVGQKYFKDAEQLSKGLTLGLGTLLESKHIFLLVSGSHKAAIVKKLIEGNISEEIPASLLRCHPSLTIYLDADAAQMLDPKI